MEYSSPFRSLLLITCAVSGIHSSAIHRELDFLLTEDTSQFYGLSPAKDEYTVIHVGDSISRTKRSATSPEVTQVSFKAFGEDYRIGLRSNSALIPHGLYAEYVNKKGDVIQRKEIVSHGCHYIGNVISHGLTNETLAAMSLCDGISGLVATGEHNLYIKPLREDHSEEYLRRTGRNYDDSVYRPHLVYRRDAADEAGAENDEEYFCGLDAEHFHLSHPELFDPPEEPPTETDGGAGGPSRKKRQTEAKYLEVMVTVDVDMVELHGDAVEEYAMDLLNMAASRFQDESIGDTPLYIRVVRFIILSSDTVTLTSVSPLGVDVTLDVSVNAETTLGTFCSYQKTLNPPSDADEDHWDLAMLLTRKDVELGNLNGLVGLATQRGTCNSHGQCLLVEDYGIAAGLILAHEIGHTLGMSHDGSERTQSCSNGRNLMANNRINGAGTFKWSQCSRSSYETFISQNTCLDDYPDDPLHPVLAEDPTVLGRVYNADRQCQLFSPNMWGACTEYQLTEIGRTISDTCGILHCVENGECVPTPFPSLDGTRCGNNGEICSEGECLMESRDPFVVQPPAHQSVNGGWSNWVYPECSRTCGGGVQIQYRICNNPEPAFGGAPCVGESVRPRLCRIEPCQIDQMVYKNEQCEATYGPGYTALTTEAAGDSACQINCINNSTNDIRGHGTYANGTICGGEYDRCVRGRCETFGCDGVLRSGISLDICRVCGGDGQSCRREGVSHLGFPGVEVTVLSFASGSTGIEVISWNTATPIGLTSVSDRFIINGRAQPIGQMRQFTYFGNTIYYTKTAQLESMTIPGPTSVEFDLKVMVPDDLSVPWVSLVPSIQYQYYSRVEVPVTNYVWQSVPGECTCDIAYIGDDVICILLETGLVVEDGFCNPVSRPQQVFILCDDVECRDEYIWVYGQYDGCNATCGSDSYRTRNALCVSVDGTAAEVSSDDCDHLPAPVIHERCDDSPCYEWVLSDWSMCPVSCGVGVEERSVYCRHIVDSSTVRFVDDSQCPSPKPATQQLCAIEPCPDFCSPIQCPLQQTFNPSTCACEDCAPVACGAGHIYDELTCVCEECAVQQCGSFKKFNPLACACEPIYDCGSEIIGDSSGSLSGFLVNFQPSLMGELCEVTLTAPSNYIIELNVIIVVLNTEAESTDIDDEYFQIKSRNLQRWTTVVYDLQRTIFHNYATIGLKVYEEGHGYFIHYNMRPR